MADQPLGRIRVLELAQGVAGPFAGKMFADYGADVLKIEPPSGDPARHAGPFFTEAPDPEQSALFHHLNANKRSMTLDPSTRTGRDILRSLVTDADIVIESFEPGLMAAWGLGFDDLRAINPAVVLTSVTPFGQTGPYSHYEGEEIVYYAMGGPMNATGAPDREPVQLASNMVQYQCGNVAATASMAAWMTATASGEGVWVDVSNYETQAGTIDRRTTFLVTHQYTGETSDRNAVGFGPLPIGIYPAAEGYVQISTAPAWIPRMVQTLADPDVVAVFTEAASNPAVLGEARAAEAVQSAMYRFLFEHDNKEASAIAQGFGWPITPILEPRELPTTPHFVERGFFRTVDHPAAGEVTLLGPSFEMEDGWMLRRPAPLLGEHTREVLSGTLGMTDDDIVALRASGVI